MPAVAVIETEMNDGTENDEEQGLGGLRRIERDRNVAGVKSVIRNSGRLLNLTPYRRAVRLLRMFLTIGTAFSDGCIICANPVA